MGCCFGAYHSSSSVAINTAATQLQVTFSDGATGVASGNRFCFRILQSIPTAGLTLPVYLSINGAEVALLDRAGNTVYGNELVPRYLNKGFYGSNGVISYSLPIRSTRCNCKS